MHTCIKACFAVLSAPSLEQSFVGCPVSHKKPGKLPSLSSFKSGSVYGFGCLEAEPSPSHRPQTPNWTMTLILKLRA